MTPDYFEIFPHLNTVVLITADISHLDVCVEFNDLTLLAKVLQRNHAGAAAVYVNR